MKNFILFCFNFLLCVLSLVYSYDVQQYAKKSQAETREMVHQVCRITNENNDYLIELITAQDAKNKQTEQYCADVARAIIEGAW